MHLGTREGLRGSRRPPGDGRKEGARPFTVRRPEVDGYLGGHSRFLVEMLTVRIKRTLIL